MGMQPLQVVLVACIVNFSLIYVELNQAVTMEANAINEIPESYQNIFDSIPKKEIVKRNVVYNEIMMREIMRENQVFDAMEGELHVARNKNANRRGNFYDKSIGENMVKVKRQTAAERGIGQARRSFGDFFGNKTLPPEAPKIIPSGDSLENNISRLDMRVGKIVSANIHPDEPWFMVMHVDIGEENPRRMVTPFGKHLKIEDLVNRSSIFVVNLKNFRIVAQEGKGALLHASRDTIVEVLVPPITAVPGDIVTVTGYDRKPDKEINPKMDETYKAIIRLLRTNSRGEATYKDIPWNVAGKGPAVAPTMKNTRIY